MTVATTTVRAHNRALPGEAGSDYKPTSVREHTRVIWMQDGKKRTTSLPAGTDPVLFERAIRGGMVLRGKRWAWKGSYGRNNMYSANVDFKGVQDCITFMQKRNLLVDYI